MRVKINSHLGPQFDVPSGVPQGSILAPYLFASFMGSLSRAVDADLVLYADDVSLIEAVTSQNLFPQKLFLIETWITQNRFVLNYSKTKQMIFTRCANGGDFHYPTIEVVTDLKILGVHWNKKLTWDSHFEKVIKPCSQRLRIIRILKSVLTNWSLILVYHSLITSLLLYAAPLFAWLPSRIEYMLDKFQRRAHRIICCGCCNCTAFPSLASVRKKRAISFLATCETYPEHPLHHFVPKRLPHSGHFCLPTASTSLRLHSFLPYTCQRANFIS